MNTKTLLLFSYNLLRRGGFAFVVGFGLLVATKLLIAAQDNLVAKTSIGGPSLVFDWPGLEIGVGSYEEGPTGMTIFRFVEGAAAVVDVRGGAPGSFNTDLLRVGSDDRFVDAIVFSGGGLYGQEAIGAVASGLMDSGVGSGLWNETTIVAGAEVYDFQGHRLTEIYPDRRLARSTLSAMRPGVFPYGAQGAGRVVMQGELFGCGAHSGQGGAFRQMGEIKIAAFVVVNAVGTVTDREGKLVRCNQDPSRRALKTAEILAQLPRDRTNRQNAGTITPTLRNTTLSLIVTNQKMNAAALQRLAIQVHTSMARAIQPFSTFDDGDILFAASTQEVDGDLRSEDFNMIAGELMWDAVLRSVPEEPIFEPPSTEISVSRNKLEAHAGTYQFGPHATMQITYQDGHLTAQLLKQNYFDLRRDEPIALHAIGERDFYTNGRHRTRFAFARNSNGHTMSVTLNPGRWEQKGTRISTLPPSKR